MSLESIHARLVDLAAQLDHAIITERMEARALSDMQNSTIEELSTPREDTDPLCICGHPKSVHDIHSENTICGNLGCLQAMTPGGRRCRCRAFNPITQQVARAMSRLTRQEALAMASTPREDDDFVLGENVTHLARPNRQTTTSGGTRQIDVPREDTGSAVIETATRLWELDLQETALLSRDTFLLEVRGELDVLEIKRAKVMREIVAAVAAHLGKGE